MAGTKSKKASNAQSDEKPTAIIAYKGFDKDLRCRGFQFEVGKTYEHDGEVEACKSGFHACEHPLNVFDYYAPAFSRYAEVVLDGDTARHNNDTKIAAAKITINVELSLGELTQRAVKWVFDRAKWSEKAVSTKDNEGATASGTHGAATASGDQGAATASGDQGAATASGTRGAATASGDQGAATASGTQGAATASGYQGAATASGKNSVATASGYDGRARGEKGAALFLAERSIEGHILSVWAGVVGRDGIKPMTFYALENGVPVEVE